MSTELEEIIEVSDRVAVMVRGRITGVLSEGITIGGNRQPDAPGTMKLALAPTGLRSSEAAIPVLAILASLVGSGSAGADRRRRRR